MKKLSVLVALALLAVAGTGFAVTCAYDNVPGATLLVPYFRVSGTVNTAGVITAVGTDTKVAFVNVSTPGIIAHVTIWNKYSAPVLDFNVPMTGKDVVTFNMSGVLNGHLAVNPTTQSDSFYPVPNVTPPNGDVTSTRDVCGVILGAPTTFNAGGLIGWAQTSYLRFEHPIHALTPGTFNDWPFSISKYGPGDAFSTFRLQVMQSLDESYDIMELQNPNAIGLQGILDSDNPACLYPTGWVAPSAYAGSGEFSGYITIDVVNFCTNWFPNQAEFYQYDAIATAGWGVYGYTPNVLIGDVFYVDKTAGPVGNISGDPTVNLEFDTRLNWNGATAPGTFFGRFVAATVDAQEKLGGDTLAPVSYRFGGDGREPLGDHYGLRYYANPGTVPALGSTQLRTWLLVWRGDNYHFSGVDLCYWLRNGGDPDDGFYDSNHLVTWLTYDEDENLYASTQGGGPSGGQFQPPPPLYIFLEASRIALTDPGVTVASKAIPGWGQLITTPPMLKPGNNWYAGWMDILLRNVSYSSIYNQGWIGVQHSGPGTVLSVGHAATNLNGNFQCNPAISFGPGVLVGGF